MTTETAKITDRTKVSIWNKLNPLFWLRGAGRLHGTFGQQRCCVSANDQQSVTALIWWFRNPGMNFAGFIAGVENKKLHGEGQRARAM